MVKGDCSVVVKKLKSNSVSSPGEILSLIHVRGMPGMQQITGVCVEDGNFSIMSCYAGEALAISSPRTTGTWGSGVGILIASSQYPPISPAPPLALQVPRVSGTSVCLRARRASSAAGHAALALSGGGCIFTNHPDACLLPGNVDALLIPCKPPTFAPYLFPTLMFISTKGEQGRSGKGTRKAEQYK